jgi:hypothetical protein
VDALELESWGSASALDREVDLAFLDGARLPADGLRGIDVLLLASSTNCWWSGTGVDGRVGMALETGEAMIELPTSESERSLAAFFTNVFRECE